MLCFRLKEAMESNHVTISGTHLLNSSFADLKLCRAPFQMECYGRLSEINIKRGMPMSWNLLRAICENIGMWDIPLSRDSFYPPNLLTLPARAATVHLCQRYLEQPTTACRDGIALVRFWGSLAEHVTSSWRLRMVRRFLGAKPCEASSSLP